MYVTPQTKASPESRKFKHYIVYSTQTRNGWVQKITKPEASQFTPKVVQLLIREIPGSDISQETNYSD